MKGLHHLDLNVSDPVRSAPFYDRVLRHMGFTRVIEAASGEDGFDWIAPREGGRFSIGVVRARDSSKTHDRYAPGLHHLALHAKSREDVDRLYSLLLKIDAEILDPPAEYPQYGPGYYAVFFLDPDGLKLEYVVESEQPWDSSLKSQDLQMEPKIRTARISDFDILIKLIEEYYQYDSLDFDPRRIGAGLWKLLQDGNLGCAWIAEQGAEVAGYVLLTFNYDLEFGGYEGIITDLFLREKFRGCGIGRLMIDRVEAHCRADGISTIELQVEIENRTAHSFYRKLGFSQLPRLVMSRRIPAND